MKFVYGLIFGLISQPVMAQTVAPNQSWNNIDLTQQQQDIQKIVENQHQLATQSETITATEMSEQELLAQPEFLQHLLNSALEEHNIEGVRVLIPIYQRWQQHDEILLQYAEAVVAQHDGKYQQAIDIYRKILTKRPDLTPVRVRLVENLILNKQWQAAQQHIIKIQADKDLPSEIAQQLTNAEQWLKKQQKWQVNANVRYLQEDNINQAPKHQHYGAWKFDTPQQAQGVGYDLSLSKNQSWFDHWSWRGGLFLNGESYWNAHQYDDIALQGQLGIAYQDANLEVALLPFYRYRWFAGESYSQEFGLRTQVQYHFNPQWYTFTTVQYSKKHHKQRDFLDGWLWNNALTVLYIHSPQQSWFIGTDFMVEHTQDKSDRYQRVGMRFGWEQDWNYGISTNMQLGIAQRDYQAPDIFQIQRQDTEYFMQSTIWHRALHWKGFTPKLTWQWQKTDSRHFLYDKDKNQIFLQINKRF